MWTKIVRSCFASLVLFAIAAQSSHAALIVYTNQAAWESAVSGTVLVEDFNSVATGALSTGNNAAGLIDIEIVGDPGVNAIGAGGSTDGTNFFSGEVDNSAPDIGSPNLNFSDSIIAFAADWVSTATAAILIANVAGDVVNFSDEFGGSPGTGFLGIISDTSFSQVQLRAAGPLNETFEMDNVRFVNAVPSPTTIVLLAIGIAGLGNRGRKTAKAH